MEVSHRFRPPLQFPAEGASLMFHEKSNLSRRRFLATAAKAGAVLAAPMFVPGAVLGKNGGVAASERIALAGIGIRSRGGYVLGCMMDEPVVQFVAIADVRKDCRENVKREGGREVRSRRGHVPRFPRDASPPGHRRRADRHRRPLAHDGLDLRRQGRQGHLLREALLDDDRREPGPGRHDAALRPDLSGRHAAAERGQLHLRRRPVPRRENSASSPRSTPTRCIPATNHDWLPAEPEPPKDEVDWDLWLGPTPWRPYNRQYVDGGWRGSLRLPRRRHPRMGRPHRRSLQLGRQQRSADAHPLRADPQRLHRHLSERPETGHARPGLDGPGHVQRPLRRRRRLGRNRRQRPDWNSPPAGSAPNSGRSPKPAPRPSAT